MAQAISSHGNRHVPQELRAPPNALALRPRYGRTHVVALRRVCDAPGGDGSFDAIRPTTVDYWLNRQKMASAVWVTGRNRMLRRLGGWTPSRNRFEMSFSKIGLSAYLSWFHEK
jgi:hypothetical protein